MRPLNHQGSFKAFPTNICCGDESWSWIVESASIWWQLLLLLLKTQMLLPWLVLIHNCCPWLHECSFLRQICPELLLSPTPAPILLVYYCSCSFPLFPLWSLWPWIIVSSLRPCLLMCPWLLFFFCNWLRVCSWQHTLLVFRWWVTHISLAASISLLCLSLLLFPLPFRRVSFSWANCSSLVVALTCRLSVAMAHGCHIYLRPCQCL